LVARKVAHGHTPVAPDHGGRIGRSYDTRIACRALAGGLSRQIKAKEEAQTFRERIRLRGFEDEIVSLLSREAALDEALANHTIELRKMMNADGVAVLRGGELLLDGGHPPETAICALPRWVGALGDDPVYPTDRLSMINSSAEAYKQVASGLLSLVISTDDSWIILWPGLYRIDDQRQQLRLRRRAGLLRSASKRGARGDAPDCLGPGLLQDRNAQGVRIEDDGRIGRPARRRADLRGQRARPQGDLLRSDRVTPGRKRSGGRDSPARCDGGEIVHHLRGKFDVGGGHILL
jgi:hypothetical protein